jgi:hypothetical protein
MDAGSRTTRWKRERCKRGKGNGSGTAATQAKNSKATVQFNLC